MKNNTNPWEEIRTFPHRVNVRIFRHNFVGDKAKIRRRAVPFRMEKFNWRSNRLRSEEHDKRS